MPRSKTRSPKRRSKSTSRSRKRGSGKRTLVENRAGAFFVRRTATGRFREIDQRKRSLGQDRRRKAKSAASSGRGDRGDRRR